MKSASVLLVVLGVSVAGAQDSTFRWSFSGGPTWRTRGGDNDMVCVGCTDRWGFKSGDRFIWEAVQQKFNGSVGVSRRLAGSALTLRGEVIYNRAESGMRFFHFTPDSSTTYQHAPREELLAATLGMQWDAFPTRRVSPYLLTTIGIGRTWTSWNSDTTSSKLDSRRSNTFFPVSLGAGLRARVWKHEVFVEWRRFGALASETPRIAPISFGFRF